MLVTHGSAGRGVAEASHQLGQRRAGLCISVDTARLCRLCGIPHKRHHFAYANIERWIRQGTDVAAMLPYLARYMGHVSIESTYYYIHTSPDFMDAYADITGKSQSLLPEVGFE